MKKLLCAIVTTIILCSNVTTSYSNCIAEVKDVKIDEQRGSIVVETQYKLNGTFVNPKAEPDSNYIGKTRYTEETGTLQEIVATAKADIQRHCENIIIRNAVSVNEQFKSAKAEIQKTKTQPMLDTLKANAIGWTKIIPEAKFIYKDKEVTVNADGTYSVIDAP